MAVQLGQRPLMTIDPGCGCPTLQELLERITELCYFTMKSSSRLGFVSCSEQFRHVKYQYVQTFSPQQAFPLLIFTLILILGAPVNLKVIFRIFKSVFEMIQNSKMSRISIRKCKKDPYFYDSVLLIATIKSNVQNI